MRNRNVIAGLAITLLMALPAIAQVQEETTMAVETDTVSVNGIDLYYEIYGEGQPLVLLHGGITVYETLGQLLPDLARNFRVIVPHMQGHGFTKDAERPLDYPTMAEDVMALLKHLGVPKAYFVGYSMGAGIAMRTAIREPKLVDKLVVISTAVARDGWYPEVVQAFHDMPAQAPQYAAGIAQAPFAADYPDVNWETLFRKMGDLGRVDFDWSNEVAAIAAPTLLVFADADAVRPEHIVHMYKLFGGGQRDAGLDGSGRSQNQLAILPNTTHYTLNTSKVATTIGQFLEASAPMGAN